MKSFIKTFLLLLTISSPAVAQILPEPGALLNYTQVMLEYEKIEGVTGYKIQVAEDTGTKVFEHPLIEQLDSTTATLITHLQFGKKYLWRYAGLTKGRLTKWKGPYSFEILDNPYRDIYRVRVLKNDSANNVQGLICIDGVRGIVDRNGQSVLFMPQFKMGYRSGAAVDDIRLTKYGTITSIGGQNATETDLKGNTLWTTPLKPKVQAFVTFGDFYNHDFARLDNGHYMVIGSNYVWKKLPRDYGIEKLIQDSIEPKGAPVQPGVIKLKGGYILNIEDNDTLALMNMGWLCEYDKTDNLVWSWKPDSYIRDIDLFPKGQKLKFPINWQEPHLNSFRMDAKGEFIYMSFRNLSRVIKLDKKAEKVVNSWGNKMASGEARSGEGFFHHEHDANILADGTLSVFNNGDTSSKDGFSSVVNFSQPSETDKESKVVWKFECNFDSTGVWKSVRGGNADELKNHSFLVCMGAINRVFEVTRDKQVVWNALIEQNSNNDSGWVPKPLYRAHYTSSLYPCYFTAQTNRDSLSKTNSSFTIKVFNEGTENDSYSVAVLSASKAVNEKKGSAIIQPGRSANFSISPGTVPTTSEKIEVVVTSNTNPDNKRTLILHWVAR